MYDNNDNAVSKVIPSSVEGNSRFLAGLASNSKSLMFGWGYLPQNMSFSDNAPSINGHPIVPDFLVFLSPAYLTSQYGTPVEWLIMQAQKHIALGRNSYPHFQKLELVSLHPLLAQGHKFPIREFTTTQKAYSTEPTPVTTFVHKGSKISNAQSQGDSFESVPHSVLIHTGSIANRLVRSYGADALTLGRNVFFASDKYKPNTPRGLALLVHELTHVKQLEDHNVNSGKQVLGYSQRSLFESEALRNEREALNLFSRHNAATRHDHYHHNDHQYYYFHNPFRPISGWYTHSTFRLTEYNNNIGYSDQTSRFVIKDSKDEVKNNTDPNYNIYYTYHSKYHDSALTYSSQSNNFKYSDTSQQLRSSNINSISTPLKAESGRSLPSVNEGSAESGVDSAIPPASPLPPPPTLATLDIDQVADKVYSLLERNIKKQREQRGFR